MRDRVSIMLGNREIVKRYIGDRLVWEKTTSLLYSDTLTISKETNSPVIYFYPFSNLNGRNIQKVEINGHTPSNVRIQANSDSSIEVTFINYGELLTFWRDELNQDNRYNVLFNANVKVYE